MESTRAFALAEKRRLWQGRLDDWKASGLTQVEYCRRNNLDPRKFLYWKNRFLPKPKAATFVELSAPLIAQCRPASSPLYLVIDARYRIEITPGFDADTLGRLIGVLDRQ
ncbi:MAG TPA: hypothetical protein PKV86_05755 [Syntrophobacteraceae bacterium]|nr:hypothetical protein [Syntrophobacteraceae bacterium]